MWLSTRSIENIPFLTVYRFPGAEQQKSLIIIVSYIFLFVKLEEWTEAGKAFVLHTGARDSDHTLRQVKILKTSSVIRILMSTHFMTPMMSHFC